jgi:hypothetical protein
MLKKIFPHPQALQNNPHQLPQSLHPLFLLYFMVLLVGILRMPLVPSVFIGFLPFLLAFRTSSWTFYLGSWLKPGMTKLANTHRGAPPEKDLFFTYSGGAPSYLKIQLELDPFKSQRTKSNYSIEIAGDLR